MWESKLDSVESDVLIIRLGCYISVCQPAYKLRYIFLFLSPEYYYLLLSILNMLKVTIE